MFNRKLGKFFDEPFAGTQPRVRPGEALCAVLVSRQRAEFLEFSDGTFGIDTHFALFAQECVGSRFNKRALYHRLEDERNSYL